MLKTKQDVLEYAQKTCIASIENTVNKYLSGEALDTVDADAYTVSYLEGIMRPYFGMGAVLKNTESEIYLNIRGKKVEFCDFTHKLLINSTDPESPYYIGKYRDSIGSVGYSNQTITEITGLLTGVFYCPEKLWAPIPEKDKSRIAEFIYNVAIEAHACSWPNNHYWFPMLSVLILKKLGFTFEKTEELIEKTLKITDGLYLGNGWYQDGEFGRFDYYEAWALNAYPLLWSLIEDGEEYAERKKMYRERAEAFIKYYKKWFDPDGAYPAFGRSLSNRFAASFIFPLAVLCGCNIDKALMKTLTLKNISYFRERFINEKNELLPVGFGCKSSDFVERYTSEGGVYWAAKTFIVLMIDGDDEFWTSDFCPLDSEKTDYIEKVPEKDVEIYFANHNGSGVSVFPFSAHYYQNKLFTHNFGDMPGMYGKFCYNSLSGFGLSVRDMMSADNAFILSTHDKTMFSSRFGNDYVATRDGWHIMEYKPFSNCDSTVKTFVLILPDGWHVRANLINLARDYDVTDGGFSIGLTDDYKETQVAENTIHFYRRDLVSTLTAVADFDYNYEVLATKAGCHSLEQLAFYPVMTAELKKGRYVSAAAFGIHTEKPNKIPVLSLNGNTLTVLFNNQEYKLNIE